MMKNAYEDEEHSDKNRPQSSLTKAPQGSAHGAHVFRGTLPRRAHRRAIYALTSLIIMVVYATWSTEGAVDRLHVRPSAALVNGNRTVEMAVHRYNTVYAEEDLNEPDIIVNGTSHKEEYSPWVLGAPTESFRDNLRPETKYITSWLDAGWNNDVMTFMNLLYLGHLTERVTVLPMFTPSWHIGHDVPVLPFGEVFDLPRFVREAGPGMRVVEWHEVKSASSDIVDELGCWNVWEAVQYAESKPRGSKIPAQLGLDVAYTKAPDWVKLIPGNEHDKGSSFWALARLAFADDRNSSLRSPADILPSPLNRATLDPDEHMLCYDYLYYVGGHKMLEYDDEYSPAWRFVGTHLRWTERVERLAAACVRQTFGLSKDSDVPPYITVHVRHGDFGEWCLDAEDIDDCFAPLSVIARRVREVQDELRRTRGVLVDNAHVIMTSDEDDEAWWDEVATFGWRRIDHDVLQTEENLSRWYSVILDAVIQSNSAGFVGTDRSTFSTLSRRRVLDWHGGVVRTVRWGKHGADDH